MRRLAPLLPLVALAGVLIVRRWRRARAARQPLGTPSPPAATALRAAAERFVSVPWTLVAAPDDRAQLTIRCTAEQHMALDRVDAQETPTQVFVTALMRWRPPTAAGGGDDEPAGERDLEATVQLSGPLGARELVHAPVDPRAPGDEPDGPRLYP